MRPCAITSLPILLQDVTPEVFEAILKGNKTGVAHTKGTQKVLKR